jgi:hypothetical protein
VAGHRAGGDEDRRGPALSGKRTDEGAALPGKRTSEAPGHGTTGGRGPAMRLGVGPPGTRTTAELDHSGAAPARRLARRNERAAPGSAGLNPGRPRGC